MARSLDPNSEFQVKDAFEIQNGWEIEQSHGLVIVLDRKIVAEPSELIGKEAIVLTPRGLSFRLEIDSAKDHIKATSLFFKGKSAEDVPMMSRITIK